MTSGRQAAAAAAAKSMPIGRKRRSTNNARLTDKWADRLFRQ